jgi:hypothetical protein
MRFYLLLCFFTLSGVAAQAQKQDTVIINIAKTSKIIFTIEDRDDIQILKHYNFQELFQDVLKKLEANDTTGLVKNGKPDTEEENSEVANHDSDSVG